MPNLHDNIWKWSRHKALVKIYTSWLEVSMCLVVIRPDCNFSQTTWQSISICFVRSWKTGFWAMWRAAWLSQYKIMGLERWMSRSWRSVLSHVSSQVVDARARYSASAEEWETVYCFLVRQEIGLVPSWMKKPMVDLRVSGQLAQSESE